MKKLALLAGLLLAGATAASAEPRMHEGRWVELSTDLRTESGSQAVPVNTGDAIDRLKLEATRGTPYIKRVIVRYTDGERQSYSVGRALSYKQHDQVAIPLQRGDRQVDQIVVITRADRDAAYTVSAEI